MYSADWPRARGARRAALPFGADPAEADRFRATHARSRLPLRSERRPLRCDRSRAPPFENAAVVDRAARSASPSRAEAIRSGPRTWMKVSVSDLVDDRTWW